MVGYIVKSENPLPKKDWSKSPNYRDPPPFPGPFVVITIRKSAVKDASSFVRLKISVSPGDCERVSHKNSLTISTVYIIINYRRLKS